MFGSPRNEDYSVLGCIRVPLIFGNSHLVKDRHISHRLLYSLVWTLLLAFTGALVVGLRYSSA